MFISYTLSISKTLVFKIGTEPERVRTWVLSCSFKFENEKMRKFELRKKNEKIRILESYIK